jgi:hypothetical protein
LKARAAYSSAQSRRYIDLEGAATGVKTGWRGKR